MQTVEGNLLLPALPPRLTLGSVQNSYIALGQRLTEYRSFVSEPYYLAKLQALQRQRDEYEHLNTTLTEQQEISLEELAISQQMFKRNKQLFERQILARGQFEKSQAEILQKQSDSKMSESALANNQIRMSAIEGEIIDLLEQHADQERTLRMSLLEGLISLKNDLASWEQRYLLRAPITGQVTFPTVLHENKYVQMAEVVMVVVPHSGDVFGQMLLSQATAGKVKLGQKVKITVGGYSNTEVGVVEGVIKDISLATQNNKYLIHVELPQGLRTSYGVSLEFRQEMQGAAEIVMEDQRLFLRVFNWVRFLFDENVS